MMHHGVRVVVVRHTRKSEQGGANRLETLADDGGGDGGIIRRGLLERANGGREQVPDLCVLGVFEHGDHRSTAPAPEGEQATSL